MHKIIKADLDRNHRIQQNRSGPPDIDDIDERITLRYVVRGDDDIVPSCMAVCAYSPNKWDTTTERFSVGVNRTNNYCPGDIFEGWPEESEDGITELEAKQKNYNDYGWQGTVEKDDDGQDIVNNLQLNDPDTPDEIRDNDYKPVTPVCKIGNDGLHNDDFSLNKQESQKVSRRIANYTVEAFDVPLVGCDAEIFRSGRCRHGSVIADFHGLNPGSERELVGCYCNTNPDN